MSLTPVFDEMLAEPMPETLRWSLVSLVILDNMRRSPTVLPEAKVRFLDPVVSDSLSRFNPLGYGGFDGRFHLFRGVTET